jgi:hypothetical protein
MSRRWLTVDLRPVPGWRAAILPEVGGLHLVDLLGWAVQGEVTLDEDHEKEHTLEGARRRVIPVVVDRDGQLQDPRDDERFWYIFGPSDPDPTQSDADAERKVRAERVRPTTDDHA